PPRRSSDLDVSSPRTHVACVDAQQAFFGSQAGLPDGAEVDAVPDDAGLLVVGTSDTRLLRLPGAALREATQEEAGRGALLVLLEGWIAAIGRGIGLAYPPPDIVFGHAGEVKNVRVDSAFGAQS